MKIIPVASGKGGVGKTTFCLNLALSISKYGKTVLIDLDPGTSSLRTFLDMPVKKDIYHFLKKNIPIDECITPLNKSLDPEGLFKNFFLIASPKNFVYDIVNFSDSIKARLIQGINSIRADYVIIDNKAGLDTNVMDFLPVTNTGILIFTPKMKAATLTAAEMVRAALFRICRTLLTQQRFNFSIYSSEDKLENLKVITSIKEKIDETYENDEESFEDFLVKLNKKFKKNVIIRIIRQFVENYRVYFILNQFDSVQESADKIIKPFVEKVYASISSKISITNLGWLIEDREIEKSVEYGLPYLLMQHYRKKQEEIKLKSWYSELTSSVGINKKKVKKDVDDIHEIMDDEIGRQLNLLNKMYTHGFSKDPLANLDFIVEGIKAIGLSSTQDLGMRRILTNQEIRRNFY